MLLGARRVKSGLAGVDPGNQTGTDDVPLPLLHGQSASPPGASTRGTAAVLTDTPLPTVICDQIMIIRGIHHYTTGGGRNMSATLFVLDRHLVLGQWFMFLITR